MDGKIQSRVRQSGASTYYTYNAFGQLVSVISGGSVPAAPVHYEYDPYSGQATARTDAGGRHGLTYDVATGLPDGESIGTAADSVNLLAGAYLHYGMDSQQRRQTLDAMYAGQLLPHTSYQYSPLGRLSRVTSDAQQVDYAYVPRSTLVEHRDYHSPASGPTLALTSAHHYDARGNLDEVTHTQPALAGARASAHHCTVDELGRRLTATREDATRWTYDYDARSQVISGRKSALATANTPASLLPGAQMAYTYDNIGNRLTSYEGGDANGNNLRTVTYSPANGLNQYGGVTRSSTKADFLGTRAGTSTSQAVTALNAATNTAADVQTVGPWWRTEISPYATDAPFAKATLKEGGVNVDGTNAPPRLAATYPGGFTVGYDADGNVVSDGRWLYVWDSDNRLFSAAGPGQGPYAEFHIIFIYDADGHRIGKHVSGNTPSDSSFHDLYTDIYLYDGWNLIATYRMDYVAVAGTSLTPIPVLRQAYT